MKKTVFVLLLGIALMGTTYGTGGVGINSTALTSADTSASLDLSDPNKGFLTNRLTLTSTTDGEPSHYQRWDYLFLTLVVHFQKRSGTTPILRLRRFGNDYLITQVVGQLLEIQGRLHQQAQSEAPLITILLERQMGIILYLRLTILNE